MARIKFPGLSERIQLMGASKPAPITDADLTFWPSNRPWAKDKDVATLRTEVKREEEKEDDSKPTTFSVAMKPVRPAKAPLERGWTSLSQLGVKLGPPPPKAGCKLHGLAECLQLICNTDSVLQQANFSSFISNL